MNSSTTLAVTLAALETFPRELEQHFAAFAPRVRALGAALVGWRTERAVHRDRADLPRARHRDRGLPGALPAHARGEPRHCCRPSTAKRWRASAAMARLTATQVFAEFRAARERTMAMLRAPGRRRSSSVPPFRRLWPRDPARARSLSLQPRPAASRRAAMVARQDPTAGSAARVKRTRLIACVSLLAIAGLALGGVSLRTRRWCLGMGGLGPDSRRHDGRADVLPLADWPGLPRRSPRGRLLVHALPGRTVRFRAHDDRRPRRAHRDLRVPSTLRTFAGARVGTSEDELRTDVRRASRRAAAQVRRTRAHHHAEIRRRRLRTAFRDVRVARLRPSRPAPGST